MEFKTLLLENQDNTLIITINRPEVFNALDSKVVGELDAAMDLLRDTPEYKGAIITGAGDKSFVAGADISEVNKLEKDATRKYSERGQKVFSRIERSGKPVIAAVNGFALGGGCELAMSCHMRVATEKAKFGQPEVNLGLIAGYGGTQRLPRLIGLSKATELLLTGDHIRANEALSLGLVNYVTTPEELIPKCQEILQKIYSKSPLAVALTLDSIYEGILDPEDGYKKEAKNFGKSAASHDGKEGTAAFLEKRKPAFTGE